ncbi:MAG: hypothetical protein KAY24_12590 [Candidatus Eisenbacteria sp.]|nr:hypothetical protein [Candidatus Eisenbacteria bacterium]
MIDLTLTPALEHLPSDHEIPSEMPDDLWKELAAPWEDDAWQGEVWEGASPAEPKIPPRLRAGLNHLVPPPLQYIGCMWYEDGDEACRCGKPVAWVMGGSNGRPRVYCEEHGQRIRSRMKNAKSPAVNPALQLS